MSKYERPELPYKGEKLPNNSRIGVLTKAKKPMTADLLDGEFNYVIDSLNEVEKDIGKAITGKLIGSDKSENANKVIITDGEKAPTLSWVTVDSKLIANNAIEDKHILEKNIKTKHIDNQQITNEKIVEESIKVDRISGAPKSETPEEMYTRYSAWAKKIGMVGDTSNAITNGRNAIVVKDKDGAINVVKINSPTITELEAKINNIVTEGLQKAIDDAWEKEHPIYALSFYPSRQGDTINGNKVNWKLMETGRVVVTGQTIKEVGINSITDEKCSTEEHKLTIEQIPSHSHGLTTYPAFDPSKKSDYVQKGTGGKIGSPSTLAYTGSTGSGETHSHKLDLKRLELLIYRRMS